MKIHYLLIVSILVSIAGCVNIPQETIEIKRYAIEPAGEFTPADTTLNLSLRVAPFSSDAIFRGTRMVYRKHTGETDYYFYHRWIAPLSYQLTDALSANLLDWGLFSKGVMQEANGPTPYHEIQCRLNTLCAVNLKKDRKAALEVYLMVYAVNPKTYEKSTIFQKKYALEQERNKDNVPSFIEAANLVVGQWFQEVRTDLLPVFLEEAKKYGD